MNESDSCRPEGQNSTNSFLPLPLPRQLHHEGRRSSLGSGMVGALLQFQQRHNLLQKENQGLGVSFYAEYELINKETNNATDIHLNKLRDRVRSRSEPCLSLSRRSKPSSFCSSRCLSPLTPRRQLHPSPRHLVAALGPRGSNASSNRRWSYASLPSHPSSGYMTQNSTPPSHSACSSSAEKIYRSDVESIEDLRKCSPMSLSNSFSSHQLEIEKREIEDRNIVYREKFPKVREQMEEKLENFIKDEEAVEESLSGGDATWAFIHIQLIEIARITLKKSQENSITCQVFADNSERCELLKDEGKQKSGSVNHDVLHSIRKYLQIIARPARLLEYVEFNTDGFISLLDQFEDSARRDISEHNNLEPHRYILKMLGLDCPTDSTGLQVSSDDENYKKTSSKVTQDDFDRIKIISQGAYAAVYLVKHKETRQRFAMKRIAKQSLQLRNQVQRAFLERDIMTFTENPFVVSMYCSFETKNHLCMIMEYVEGGDVRTLLNNIETLPEEITRMYSAEVVLALEYLHSYGIVHRDLKPDNLLITSLGHIKLTDFGLSKVGLMRRATEIYEERDIEEGPKFDDQDMVGTPDYLAPEVILKQDYNSDVDWWALGVIIYEVLHGITPFYGETVEEVFSNIRKGDVEFAPDEDPDDPWIQSEAKSIILAFLDLDVQNRLTNPELIKEHPYFKGIEWENILRKKAQFIPELQNDEDTSYFDPRCDRYHHGSSDEDDLSSLKSSKSEVNIENIGFSTSSNKFNSFHKKEAESTVSPRLSSSSVGEVAPVGSSGHSLVTNAAKEIMNHHESRSRLIRDSSCDSIQDEVFNNRHRLSSDISSDNDIHFNIGGDSDEEELTLTPTSNVLSNTLSRRLSNSSGCESDGSSIRDRFDRLRHLSSSSLRRVPKSASTSSIPESRLIIPVEQIQTEKSTFRDSLLSSEASSRDSSPNRPASPVISSCDVRTISIPKSKKDYPGFTVMTIPVYIGSSNNYTLHHLVKSVLSSSKAADAGLKEMDLITHIRNECVQGWLYTDIVTAILDRKTDLSLTVVPIDSTAISLQQCQPRKRGKLVRKHQRRHQRLKNRGYRMTHRSNELQVPDSSSGRTSPRTVGGQKLPVMKSTRPALQISKGGRSHGRNRTPHSRRKSTSHISSISKPLSPLAASTSHVPVSPLARTPSPGHNERLQGRASSGKGIAEPSATSAFVAPHLIPSSSSNKKRATLERSSLEHQGGQSRQSDHLTRPTLDFVDQLSDELSSKLKTSKNKSSSSKK
jgi:microtubule-associated serine/threonine kinase